MADDRFNYTLLDRLRCDCEYYLGYGSRDANHSLWAHDEQKQIDKMREFYDLLLNLNGLQENELMSMQQE